VICMNQLRLVAPCPRKIMRALYLFLVLLSMVVAAEGVSRLSVGPLVLQLPAGWRITGNSQRVESHGPDGQTLIANYASLISGAVPDPASHVLETARGFAHDRMPGLAEKNGKVIRPVTEQGLPDARYEFSSASQGRRMFRDYYFMQYLFTSKQGMVYLTLEGYGEASKAAAYFDDVLATQQWVD
jgi:hypothetical protein